MEEPICRSKPTAKSLWREYRLFPDRIELDSIPCGTVRVQLADVKAVSVRPAGVVLDLFRGDYGLGELMRSLELDLADIGEHVALEKTGSWKRLHFTPDDPAAFKSAVDRALAARPRGQER